MHDASGDVPSNCCKRKNMSYKVLKFTMCLVVILDWLVQQYKISFHNGNIT